jgi:hypothetical protein
VWKRDIGHRHRDLLDQLHAEEIVTIDEGRVFSLM